MSFISLIITNFIINEDILNHFTTLTKVIYDLNFSKSTNLVPQLGYFFFYIKTTEYINKLIENCHIINDDRKSIKLEIIYTLTKVSIGRSTIMQTAFIHL